MQECCSPERYNLDGLAAPMLLTGSKYIYILSSSCLQIVTLKADQIDAQLDSGKKYCCGEGKHRDGGKTSFILHKIADARLNCSGSSFGLIPSII